ncbi:AraC family transcriptional regulator [Paenibacillus kyungheensis]
MPAGFEAIPLHGQPVIWTKRHTTINQGKGFYHWHQCCEILLIFAGEGIVVINNKTYPIKRGMLFFFQPFEIHKVYSQVSQQVPYDRAVIHINHAYLEKALSIFPHRQSWFNQLCSQDGMERAFELNDKLEQVASYVKDYEYGVDVKKNTINEELLVFMLRLLSVLQFDSSSPEQHISAPRRQPMYSERIMDWVETNYMESNVLNQLSNELHLHRSYVSRIFKKETGSRLNEYITAKRIKVAAHLLESTTMSIETIGHKVGFHNISHFISCFKKTYHSTPLQYRLDIQKNVDPNSMSTNNNIFS